MLVSGTCLDCSGNFLVRLFFTTLLLTYLLSACGLKGPLYMPPPVDTAKPASSDVAKPASSDEAEKK